jgi:hypothetical protein
MLNQKVTVKETGEAYFLKGDKVHVYRGVYKGYHVLSVFLFDRKGNKVGDKTEYRKPDEVEVDYVNEESL